MTEYSFLDELTLYYSWLLIVHWGLMKWNYPSVKETTLFTTFLGSWESIVGTNSHEQTLSLGAIDIKIV